MVTITLSEELEQVICEEAGKRGMTAELLATDVLQSHFLHSTPTPALPEGATLADALADYIGAGDSRDKYSEGSTLSQNTGHKFAQAMVAKHEQGKL